LLFQDRLKQSIEHSRRNNKQLALLFLDLDRFKFVNDTYGHDIGDLLLVEVTKRLEKSIREVDTIARLGGDEFTIILEDINKPYNATNIARQIIESMSMPYYIKGHECFIGASIGISIYPTDSTDSKALAKYADIAMYRAKERGKNCYQEFNQAMSANIARRINTETQLRHAIERNEFVLHYQPQYNTFSGELIGVEALLRWRINDEELISPDEFVPILEDSGLITPVGEWVLHEACQQHLAWKKKFKSKIRIAINISPKQLVHKNIITTISSILDDNFMEPNYLELEITENALMEYPDLAIPILQKLNNMDIQLSIDDFGTGYSSLGYLKQLPIHSVKIDRSFIRDIPNDQDDVEIVRAIISMGHSLNLGIVAEGVENEEQLEFLKKLDCDIVQGFLFNQPLTVDKINELLDPKVNTTWFNVIKYKKQ
jgi:diguanylate cyclase (GGDEF)-like protein